MLKFIGVDGDSLRLVARYGSMPRTVNDRTFNRGSVGRAILDRRDDSYA